MQPGSIHASFQDMDAEIPFPAHCCQHVIAPYPSLRWHAFFITSNICCTYLLSQSIFTHPLPHLSFSLERLVLTFSWPLVPVFPRPLLPSSNKLSLCLSHAVPYPLFSIYKAISSYSPKVLPKSNSPLWYLQNPWQILFSGSGLSLWPTSSHYLPTFLSLLCIALYLDGKLLKQCLICILHVQHLAYAWPSPSLRWVVTWKWHKTITCPFS